MKDLVRQKIAVEPAVADLLLKQIQVEATAAEGYLAMAGWCAMHGFENSSEFYYKQASDERGHMRKVHRFLCDMGIQPVSASPGDVEHNFSTLRSVFEKSLEMEIAVTESIHSIMAAARKNNDYVTERFLTWFIDEQVEEEYVARRALELMDLFGEDSQGLALFDERVLNISYEQN